MIHLKKSVLVPCLVLLFTCYSNAQQLVGGEIYTTGNIVQPTTSSTGSTWIGAVYQDSLTCWSAGDPGYCGPSAIVGPGNNFNFSYGSSYVYQQQHISTLLPSVTGLQVNGYNFGFTAKNGNGWDDGRTDNLTALVRFWDNTNGRAKDNLLYGNSYNLNYKFNWTNFNYSETFVKPLQVPAIGQVQYGFIGQDNNGWAGPYGPEIYNISFSLKYSVDPCVTNPLSSPSCPGYLDQIAKLVPPAPALEPVHPPPEPPQHNTAETQPQQPPPSFGAMLPPPPPQQQNVSSAPAPAAVEQQRSVSGPGLGFALSLISKNAERENQIVQQAVQQAVGEAAAAGDRTLAAAQQTAATSVSTSLTSSSSNSTQTNATNQALSTTFALTPQYLQQNISGTSVQQQSVALQTTGPMVDQHAPMFVRSSVTQTQNFQESETPVQSIALVGDRTSPLREAILPEAAQSQTDQPDAGVKKSVANNELAGNTDLTNLATQPQGYAAYMNFTLKDAPFYASREVYTNQKTVDNIRALRQLSTQRLHQQMIEAQYR